MSVNNRYHLIVKSPARPVDLVQRLHDSLQNMPENKKGSRKLNREVQALAKQTLQQLAQNNQYISHRQFDQIFSKFEKIQESGGFQRCCRKSQTEAALTDLFCHWIPLRFHTKLTELKKSPTNALIRELDLQCKYQPEERTEFLAVLLELFPNATRALAKGISPDYLPLELQNVLRERRNSTRKLT